MAGRMIAVDAGRSFVKVKPQFGDLFKFPSYIGHWADRENPEFVEGDIEMEYEGEKYFVGQLAKRESDDWYQPYMEDKAVLETVLLTLGAIYLAGFKSGDVSLITGVPVNRYKLDKERLKDLLKRKHEVIINGEHFTYNINRILIGIEGGSSFYQYPREGRVRIIDIGSRTTNVVTYEDYVYINRESTTLDMGWETYKEITANNAEALTKSIVGQVSRRKWSLDDPVLVVGGVAELMLPYLKNSFPNAEVVEDAIYSNVKGYYALGVTKSA